MTILLKGMGIDAEKVMGQAAALGAAFERIARTQDAIATQLLDLADNQIAIMTHLGMMVPPPTGQALEVIAAESARYVAQHGGLSADELAARELGSAHGRASAAA